MWFLLSLAKTLLRHTTSVTESRDNLGRSVIVGYRVITERENPVFSYNHLHVLSLAYAESSLS